MREREEIKRQKSKIESWSKNGATVMYGDESLMTVMGGKPEGFR